MRVSLGLLLALGIAIASGCGGDDDDGAAGSGGASAGTGESSAAGDGKAGEGTADAGTETEPEPGADAGTSTDAGTEGEAISSMFANRDTEEPLTGVEVCWHGDTSVPCVTTGEDGTYTLGGLTRGEWGYVSAEIEGYPTLNQWIVAYERSSFPYRLWDDGRYTGFSADIGETWDDSKGMVSLYVIPETGGVTFSIDPMSGSGPHYTEDGAYVLFFFLEEVFVPYVFFLQVVYESRDP